MSCYPVSAPLDPENGCRGHRRDTSTPADRMPRGLAVFLLLLAPLAAGQEVDKKARVPQIKSLDPPNGAGNVDPSLREIRVTFDMSMARDGYSFVGGGPTFPTRTDAPRWLDAYTCVMPVKLKPHHDYAFGINSEKYKNFQSFWGVPVEPVWVTFRTGGTEAIERSPEGQRRLNVESFDALADALRRGYSYREVRGVDWEALFAEHRGEVVSQESTEGWARAAAAMLSSAGDAHMSLEYEGQAIPTFRRQVEPNFDLDGVQRVIANVRQQSPCVFVGQTEDGLGYLLITSWARQYAGDLARLAGDLAGLAGMKGLVIDVRPNGGGDESLARSLAGWFVSERRVYAKHTFRKGPSGDDFTPVRERVVTPNDPSRRFAGPVVILMGPANMSSCEAFLLMMKQAERTTLVGQRSYGSSGNPKPTYLPNGVVVSIPAWKALRPDGTCFEGEGIAPDVSISSEGVDLKRQDPVLEAALKVLRETLAGNDK